MPNKPRRIYSFADFIGQSTIAEPKKDGYRALYHDGQLWTRHGRPHRKQPDNLLQAFAALPKGSVVDGELMRTGSTYWAFDLLQLGQRDLRKEPLARRRMALASVLPSGLLLVPQVAADEIAQAYGRWIADGEEGMILKDTREGYFSTWYKVKP